MFARRRGKLTATMSAAYPITRRDCLHALGIAAAAGLTSQAAAESPEGFALATFTADVTVPIGHGMMGGAWKSTKVADPLEARGIVLTSAVEKPIVFVSVDWCE